MWTKSFMELGNLNQGITFLCFTTKAVRYNFFAEYRGKNFVNWETREEHRHLYTSEAKIGLNLGRIYWERCQVQGIKATGQVKFVRERESSWRRSLPPFRTHRWSMRLLIKWVFSFKLLPYYPDVFHWTFALWTTWILSVVFVFFIYSTHLGGGESVKILFEIFVIFPFHYSFRLFRFWYY